MQIHEFLALTQSFYTDKHKKQPEWSIFYMANSKGSSRHVIHDVSKAHGKVSQAISFGLQGIQGHWETESG